MLYWEDFAPGQVYELGSHTVTGEEIVEFASRWDPQPFHVDEEAAKRSSFEGLAASGWHTACISMRLYAEGLLLDTAGMGSGGLEELRWLVPVRPGDVLSASVSVLDVAPSSKRPDRGTVFMRWEVHNGAGEVVLRMTGRGLFGRRPAEGAAPPADSREVPPSRPSGGDVSRNP